MPAMGLGVSRCHSFVELHEGQSIDKYIRMVLSLPLAVTCTSAWVSWINIVLVVFTEE